MNAPPAVMVGTYVVAYADVDATVTFVQRNNLAVEGEWLGRVPLIALCQDFETSEFMVMFCDSSWDTLAIAAGYPSLEEARRWTECSYVGIGEQWRDSTVSREAALAQHQAGLQQESCSFCGKTPAQVDMMFGGDARICSHCIEGFHTRLHDAEA